MGALMGVASSSKGIPPLKVRGFDSANEYFKDATCYCDLAVHLCTAAAQGSGRSTQPAGAEPAGAEPQITDPPLN